MKKLLLFCLIPSFLLGATIPYKVLIGGICKDEATYFHTTKKSMELTGALFEDYQILIYENNSTDGTKALLSEWASDNSKVSYTSETLTEDTSLSKYEKFALIRNKLLDQIKDSQFDDFDYVILGDMNFFHIWPIRGIKKAFASDFEWDGMIAHGVVKGGGLFSQDALRSDAAPFGSDLLGPWWSDNKPFVEIKRAHNYHSVNSAFNGFAIYKRAAIITASFSGTVTRNQEIVTYGALTRALELKHPWYDKYVEKLDAYDQIFRSLSAAAGHAGICGVCISTEEDSLVWHLEDGEDTPLTHEFVPFHSDMIVNGYDKFFISPFMVVRPR